MHRVGTLALVVALAGCVGGLPPDAATSTPEPPDATWATGSGLNTTTLAERHVEALREAGSFTVNHSEVERGGGDHPPTDVVLPGDRPPSYTRKEVDLDDRRVLVEGGVADRRTYSFRSPDAAGMRTKRCADCSVHTSSNPPTEPFLRSVIRSYSTRLPAEDLAELLRRRSSNYTYVGTVDRDGETLYRYRAAGEFDAAAANRLVHPRNYTATILVTRDGVVRLYRLRGVVSLVYTDDGEERRERVVRTVRRTYTDVGETTVERPAWATERTSATETTAAARAVPAPSRV